MIYPLPKELYELELPQDQIHDLDPAEVLRIANQLGFTPLACAVICVLASRVSTAAPQTATITATPSRAVWYYPFNSAPSTRETGALFTIPPNFTSFTLNRRDGEVILVFNVALPPGFPSQYRVTSAVLRTYDVKDAKYAASATTSTTDGHVSRLELFAAGFGSSLNEATWDFTGTNFIGSNGFNSPTPRDPYPRDLVTNANVSDTLAGTTPWSVGTPAVAYTPAGMTTAFPVDYPFDVNNPTIQAEFKNDLAAGKSSWALTSTYELDFSSSFTFDAGSFPTVILTAAGAASRTPAQVPQLTLIVAEEVTAASPAAWALYE